MGGDAVTRRRWKRAPCQVVVAEFVFGVRRCGADARREVQMDGEWFRCCDEHMDGLAAGFATRRKRA